MAFFAIFFPKSAYKSANERKYLKNEHFSERILHYDWHFYEGIAIFATTTRRKFYTLFVTKYHICPI